MVATLDRMGRKKMPGDGPNRRSRSPMQIPKSWWPIINKLSAIQKRPALWIVLDLVGQEAAKEGIPLPKAPWETDYKETE